MDKINASKHDFDPYNEDGVFKAQHKNTKKWGMFQLLGDEFKELIPMEYDSVNYFSFNGEFTAVYNNGKMGIYLSKWNFENAYQSIPCEYDDYKRYTVPDKNIRYLALKKDSLWAWADWMTGEIKTEFMYNLEIEQMPYPNYEQFSMTVYPFEEVQKNYNQKHFEKTKDKKTKKWGLKLLNDTIADNVIIPELYDQVDFFDESETVAGVYKKGKVGLFIPYWVNENKQTTECEYDDYKIFYITKQHPNNAFQYINLPYVAVKKNGLWAWINYKTGILQTEFLYDLNKMSLPYPFFDN